MTKYESKPYKSVTLVLPNVLKSDNLVIDLHSYELNIDVAAGPTLRGTEIPYFCWDLKLQF